MHFALGNWDWNNGARVADVRGVLWLVDNSECLLPMRWQWDTFPFIFRAAVDAVPQPGWGTAPFPIERAQEFHLSRSEKAFADYCALFVEQLGVSEQFAASLWAKRDNYPNRTVRYVRDWHGGTWVQRSLEQRKLGVHALEQIDSEVWHRLEALLRYPDKTALFDYVRRDAPAFSRDHFAQFLARAEQAVRQYASADGACARCVVEGEIDDEWRQHVRLDELLAENSEI